MQRITGLVFFFISLQLSFTFAIRTVDDDWRLSNGSVEAALIARTIIVDLSGHGDFYKIQQAIDSIPSNNARWICIHVRRGFYREKVVVPMDKPFIYIEGEGSHTTTIAWGDASTTNQSTTFVVEANNFVAKFITFKNTYDRPVRLGNVIRQAVAATVNGDKVSFYYCSFLSVQDTLWDSGGRHYFKNCYIEGAIDFIFGAGQSIYEKCDFKVTADPKLSYQGSITAQGREKANDPDGFVFKFCSVSGTGKAFLGRAWRAYSRVLYYKTYITDIVVPEGWDAWNYIGHESTITYAESGCTGAGSNMAQRVKWEKTLSASELNQLIRMSFIDADGWVGRQP